MKRKYYRYMVYCLLALAFGAAILYLKNFALSSPSGIHLKREETETSLEDSLRVIKLNKEAFDLRLTDPQKTTALGDNALRIAKNINYIRGIADSHRIIGLGLYYQNKIQSAIKNYMDALRYYEIVGDIRKQARIYNNIGNLYSTIEDTKQSMFYFTRSLYISKGLNDQELTAGLYFNMARAYEQQGSYKKAILFFDKSYEFFKRTKDEYYITMYFQNIGVVYFKQGDFKQAKSFLKVAVDRAKKLKLYKTIAGCYLTLSKIYIHDRNYQLVSQTLNEGKYYADIFKDEDVKDEFSYRQYELQNALGDYKGAINTLARLYKKDSLELNQKSSQNIGISTQHYVQQQKLQERELLIEKQKSKEATFKWIITLGILIFLLCAGAISVIYWLRKSRRKRQDLLVQSQIATLQQKALQAMMNPHFVFNVITAVQHFVNQADTKSATEMLSKFSRLARKHLDICMSSTITVEEELAYLELYLALEKIRSAGKMNYEFNVDDNLDPEEILIPSMLIQPFVENAIWHGIMPKEEGGSIKLNFELVETDLLVSIIDDGIGITNSGKNKRAGHTSHGMALITERVDLLNKLNELPIIIDKRQTGDFGTIILIRIPV
ncbi:MAG: tetratricopeptide repeat-containing sensor histidine kinase [Daejeonella sp.]